MTNEKLIPLSEEVAHWPEYKAFARRLGIDTTLPMTSLRISLPCCGTIRIVQEFRGIDADRDGSVESFVYTATEEHEQQ